MRDVNVPVWHWHAKITEDVLLCVSALLMADEHEAHAIHGSNTTDQRRVVKPTSIAMQL